MKQQTVNNPSFFCDNESSRSNCRIKILVCYYQPWELPKNPLFLPIQAGKAVSKFDLKIQGDDTGNNISDKNATFSEFTAWYWVWKNIKTIYPNIEYVGLSHYRRFFNLENVYFESPKFIKVKIPEMKNYDRLFVERLSSADIILSKPSFFSCSVKKQFSHWHNESDYLCLKDIIHDICPQYDDSFKLVFENNNGISLYCMFVSRYELFNDYFSWLFAILFEAEKRINVSEYNTYNKRVLAFLAERLLNVYVLHHNLKAAYEPIYFIEPEINFRNSIKKLCKDIVKYCLPNGIVNLVKERKTRVGLK
ncbi:MAG: DUF4422 domain-containing protein [Chitinispirillales bacterium]|jgi:hypothetical protein|nr:DUF4422 domain-containing protein [Chitinispirillales bacterium]